MPITKLEVRERRARVTNTGTEVTRVFYVEPYDAHVTLISALLGTVDDDGTRNDPATDGYLDYCYCVEAQLESFDKLAMLGSPTLNRQSNGNVVIPADKVGTADSDDILTMVSNLETPWGVPSTQVSRAGGYGHGSVGAYVTAIFKPLVFAKPSDWGANGALVEKWDMVNPLITPITKVSNCGKNIEILTDIFGPLSGTPSADTAKTDADAFVTQPMSVFTIERRMVRVPPLRAIDKLRGHVNGASIGFTDGLVIYFFPMECLRFDEATIEKMIVPDATGAINTYFNITYSFTANMIHDYYWNNGAADYQKDFVGFNTVLGCPMDGSQPAQIKKGLFGDRAHTAYWRVGWLIDDPFFSELIGGKVVRPLYLPDSSETQVVAGLPVQLTFKNLFINGTQ